MEFNFLSPRKNATLALLRVAEVLTGSTVALLQTVVYIGLVNRLRHVD